MLAAYVDDETAVSYGRLRGELAAQTRRALVHPVFFGSAITGAGVDALIAGITELLPAAEGDADGPVSGTVFKVERGPAGEKIAYVRMFSGTVRTRDRLRFGGDDEGKVTAISVFDRGSAVRRASVAAGQIGKLWGSATSRSATRSAYRADDGRGSADHFAPPTLETVVVPRRPADKGALHVALAQLAEQDPLINLRQDDIRQEISSRSTARCRRRSSRRRWRTTSASTSTFRETTTICIERPVGTGAAVEIIGKDAQSVSRHRRAARRAGAGRHRRGVPAGGRARVDAALRSSRRSRRPCRRRCAKGSTAGRSPTARSP